MNELLSLAERCEVATGPDREIDAAICVIALGYVEQPFKVKGWRDFETPDGYRASFRAEGPNWELGWGWKPHFEIPPYTASVDAALTLVPEGKGRWPQQEYISPNPNDAKSRHRVTLWCEGKRPVRGKHPTSFALAICAAALRAKAGSKL